MHDQRTPLSAIDWIQAAFRALARGGPQAIRAEAIARDLKVSKGSFYWHFKDVPALKKAMLDHWRERATEAIITQVDTTGGTAAERLHRLVDISTGTDTSAYGGVKVEAAIRDWARYDQTAREAVGAVDERRIEFVAVLFCKHGTSKASSESHARLLYGGLIGLEALCVHAKLDRNLELTRLLDLLLAAKP